MCTYKCVHIMSGQVHVCICLYFRCWECLRIILYWLPEDKPVYVSWTIVSGAAADCYALTIAMRVTLVV